MAIPMPSLDRSGLFEGMMEGNKVKHARNQLEQQWQQHLQDLEMKKIQQARLDEQFALEKQLHPLQMQLLGAQTSAASQKARKLAQEQQFMQMFLGGQSPSNM